MLFNLPQDLAQHVLNDWLNDAKSISALDVACSTDELREEFLGLIRHPQFFLSVLEESKAAERCAVFVKWLSVRKVKTATLLLDVQRLADIAAITFLRQPSVTTLKLKHCGDNNFTTEPEHLAYLLRRCPALTCFHVDCATYYCKHCIGDVEILALLLAPSLPLRSLLLNKCRSLQESTIRSVVFCFRHTLRELDVGNVAVSDAALDFIALACPNLETLHICGLELHPAAILRYCADVGAKLKHFQLFEYGDEAAYAPEYEEQDGFVFQLVDCLPLLETLFVAFADTTSRSLQYVLEHCPNIVSAGFDAISIAIATDSNNEKSCRLAFNMEPCSDAFPFMSQLPFKVTQLELEDCRQMTEDVVAPFLATHGADIEILQVEVVVSNTYPDDSSDERIVLLNGCINTHTVRLIGWPGLNQEVAAKLFPNHHLHLTALDIIRSPLLNDVAVSFLLDRCPALKSLTIAGSPLVTDGSLETIASKCVTLRIWSLHGTSISARGLIKLAVQLPSCPFDSISVEHRHIALELKAILMNMGEVGRIWMKQLKLQ